MPSQLRFPPRLAFVAAEVLFQRTLSAEPGSLLPAQLCFLFSDPVPPFAVIVAASAAEAPIRHIPASTRKRFCFNLRLVRNGPRRDMSQVIKPLACHSPADEVFTAGTDAFRWLHRS